MAFDPFKCPTAVALPILDDLDVCQTSIDQIQRMALQLSAGAGFSSTTIKTEAAWMAAIAEDAPDNVTITPVMQKVVVTPGDVIETADVNNLNGMPQHEGYSFSTVTGEFHNADHALIAELKKVAALSSRQAGRTDLKTYWFGENNRITATASANGIPVFNFTISDVMTEGKRKPNIHRFRFLLPDGWSENIDTFDASFDPVSLTV